jgi:predicted acetyltransferase
MGIEIRTVAPDEYAAAIDVMTSAFLERPDVARVAESVRDRWDAGRTWVAFDGTRACGTFRSWATDLTVPGGVTLPAAAVSGVTVLPTHRRRGIMTGMAAREHAAIRERGEAVGILHSCEYPIYGRFGYGPATRTGTMTLDVPRIRFHGAPATGVEMVTPDAVVRDEVRAIHEAWRIRRAGEIRRGPSSFDMRLGLVDEPWGGRWKGFVALRRDAGGAVDGFVRYKAVRTWDENHAGAVVEVQELYGLTDAAYAALWRFLAEIDLLATVRADGRPLDERLPWLLTDARAARITDVEDGLWVRLFDVPRALEARTYAATGNLVLEVPDDAATGGRWRLALDASPEGASCRPTERDADLVLPVMALGAAYLGGTRLRDVVVGTGFEERSTGALAMADRLFRAADEPWCSTGF